MKRWKHAQHGWHWSSDETGMRAAGWVLESESLDAALPEAPPQPFVFPFVQPPAPERRKPGRPKKG